MKLILGFLKPTQGTVTVGKKRVGKDVDFPQDVGAIIENVDFILLASHSNSSLFIYYYSIHTLLSNAGQLMHTFTSSFGFT